MSQEVAKESWIAGYFNGSATQALHEMEALMQNYDRLSYRFVNPGENTSISIWTRNQTIPPRGSISWNLLDTFINHIDISTNSSVRFLIVDAPNFVRFSINSTFLPLDDYTGMHYVRTERLSQGCALYTIVIVNRSTHPVLIMPNVTATYAPTQFLTGWCSLSP